MFGLNEKSWDLQPASIDVEPPILNEGMGVISDGYMDIGGGSSNAEMTGP